MEWKNDLLSALDYLDPDSLTYEEWIEVGMALKAEGLESEFDPWSRKGNKYKPGEPDRKIASFKNDGVTGKTILKLAQDRGWMNPAKGMRPAADQNTKKEEPEADHAKKDIEILRLRKILTAHNTKDARIIEPGEDWNAERDLITYLEALYEPGEIVCMTIESDHDGTKWRPKGTGKSYRADQLIGALQRFSVSEWLKYNDQSGAWIRINPMDGQGCADANVTDFRYVLIESDDIPVLEQLSMIYELQLPAVAVVHSGGKSVHAVVRIDAKSREQYTQRVQFMFDICKRYGFPVDTSNKNPGRLSRMPGVRRGEGKQYLIDTFTGCSTFQEWEMMIKKGLHGIEPLGMALAKPIPLKPALIKGVLRVGHKMMIASSSKAGKTFLLMYLALAIARGSDWLGFPCMKGKVLYLNMEIDTASAEHRFQELCRVMQLDQIPANIDLMNMRGESAPLNELADRIIEVVRNLKEDYACIILDPLYKILTGDENSNSDMARMAKSADQITEETGAALIYVHHFSKGRQSDKRAIDRASGAGTFGRDADAFMTLTAYDPLTTYGDSVLECEFITREFRTPENMMVRFDYPLFEVVSRSEYPDASMEKKGQTGKEREDMLAKVREAYHRCDEVTADSGQKGVHKKALMDQIRKMFPDLVPEGLTPGQLRSKEKALIENNSELKNVGKDGKNVVVQITSSAL